MDHREMVAVIQAHIAGQIVQRHFKSSRNVRHWEDVTWKLEQFNFEVCEYRIKPEPPKPREWWIRTEKEPWEDFMVFDHQVYADGIKLVHVREVLPDEATP